MQSTFNMIGFLQNALAEDIGSGDVTSNATIPAERTARFAMNARQPITACGLIFLPDLFKLISPQVKVAIKVAEGTRVLAGGTLAVIEGPARALLAGERTALNLVQHLSAVATLTARYVKEVADTKAKVTDTRKTIPGLRYLQKYAVNVGGGHNHRMGLYDAILIKDNHIAVAGGVKAAVAAGKATGLTVEVEVDTLAQLHEALEAGADIVLLDNMDKGMLKKAVKMTAGRAKLEASGNVSLDTVRAIAKTGVDFISVGRLTHSAPAVDIGLDWAS